MAGRLDLSSDRCSEHNLPPGLHYKGIHADRLPTLATKAGCIIFGFFTNDLISTYKYYVSVILSTEIYIHAYSIIIEVCTYILFSNKKYEYILSHCYVYLHM
ncbi:hypothetical protein SORBI_3008G125801 [Sorghum bicolor]|uniref:Uncharacterized protein n=1 Tax=Sorghum bicolor TaxID=4558 RepID=A0A1Z5R6A6_SORBI|nr:hypothetical protein SORBI_3008G125801 [Sorghum bicolor]